MYFSPPPYAFMAWAGNVSPSNHASFLNYIIIVSRKYSTENNIRRKQCQLVQFTLNLAFLVPFQS
jgi:hypothetical protein